MKKVGNWFAASWGSIAFTALLLVLLGALFFVALGTLLPGVSSNELAQANSSRTVKSLIDNPIELPHKALQYSTQRFEQSAFTIRAASAIIGFVTVGCFYYVLRTWYTTRIALLGTALFATSPWFLHVVRYGGSSSMYLLLFCAVACTVWLQRSRGSLTAVLCSAFVVVGLLYIPGMIWFVVPAILWQISRIGETLEGQNAGLLTVLSLLMLSALIPLGWALYQDTNLVRTYFGIPTNFAAPVEMLKHIGEVPYQLLISGPENPELWLGNVPLLGVLAGVMFVIGLYVHVIHRRLDRVAFFGLVLAIGTLLIGIGGIVEMSLLLPFAYVIAVSGLAYMLQRWFSVFPKNPFARTLGTLVIIAVVGITVFAGLNHYFVAWPNTPETKAVYTKQLR